MSLLVSIMSEESDVPACKVPTLLVSPFAMSSPKVSEVSDVPDGSSPKVAALPVSCLTGHCCVLRMPEASDDSAAGVLTVAEVSDGLLSKVAALPVSCLTDGCAPGAAMSVEPDDSTCKAAAAAEAEPARACNKVVPEVEQAEEVGGDVTPGGA